MTRLIVRPFDPTARGSAAERKKYLQLARRIVKAQKEQDHDELFAAQDDLNTLIDSYLSTDDGTPVAEVREQLSAEEEDGLAQLIFNGAKNGNGEVDLTTVPLPSNAS